MVMRILHAGGTADTGTLQGMVETGGYAQPGISRGSVMGAGDQWYSFLCIDPDTGLPTNFNNGWVHWMMANGYSQQRTVHEFYNDAGVCILRGNTIYGDRRDVYIQFQFWNGTAWTDIPGMIHGVPSQDYRAFDIKIDMVAGRLETYHNGILTAGVDVPGIVGMNVARVRVCGAYDPWYYQQTLIATGEATIGCNVRTRYAVAAGDDTAWTGTFADDDEFPYSDADYLTAANVGDRESFTANDLPALPVSNEIKGVVVAARFRNNGGSPANIRPYLFIGGVRYPAANFPNASQGWTAGVTVFSQNPATNAPWGKDINTVNVQFGIEATE